MRVQWAKPCYHLGEVARHTSWAIELLTLYPKHNHDNVAKIEEFYPQNLQKRNATWCLQYFPIINFYFFFVVLVSANIFLDFYSQRDASRSINTNWFLMPTPSVVTKLCTTSSKLPNDKPCLVKASIIFAYCVGFYIRLHDSAVVSRPIWLSNSISKKRMKVFTIGLTW